MKTFRVVALLAIVTLAGLSSCSKKSDDIMPAPATTATTPPQTATTTTPVTTTPPATATTTPATSQPAAGFQVKVNGTVYAPDFSYALASFPGAEGYYAIYGLDSKTNDIVAIALPTTVGEGTFPINDVNAGILTYNKVAYSTINAGTGTITITKKTATNMSGTFSFTAYDATGTLKLVLTEGSFDVKFR